MTELEPTRPIDMAKVLNDELDDQMPAPQKADQTTGEQGTSTAETPRV